MIEGGGSADFATVRRMAYARPDLLQRLVDVNARAVAAYLNEQIARGRRRGDDLRHLGRPADGRRVPLVLARVDARGARARCARRRTDGACRRSCSPRAAGSGSTTIAAAARLPSGSTGPSISPTRAAASARSVALQGNLDPLVLLTDPDGRRARGGGRRARGRPGAGPHLQPRARHRAGDAARERRGAGRGRAPRIARRPRAGLIRAQLPSGKSRARRAAAGSAGA